MSWFEVKDLFVFLVVFGLESQKARATGDSVHWSDFLKGNGKTSSKSNSFDLKLSCSFCCGWLLFFYFLSKVFWIKSRLTALSTVSCKIYTKQGCLHGLGLNHNQLPCKHKKKSARGPTFARKSRFQVGNCVSCVIWTRVFFGQGWSCQCWFSSVSTPFSLFYRWCRNCLF